MFPRTPFVFSKRLLSGATIIIIQLFLNLSLVAQDNSVRHTVKSGETIESICQQYGITKAELVELNPTSERYLYAGQMLTIPLVLRNDSLEIPQKDSLQVQKEALKQRLKQKYRQIAEFDLPFSITQSIGFFFKPDNFYGNFWGISATLVGIRYDISLSDYFFMQSGVNMEFDYWMNKKSRTISNLYINANAYSQIKDYNSSISVPVMLGFKVGAFTLRGGVWGRYSWLGRQHEEFKMVVNDVIAEDDKSTTSYKNLENSDNFTYGISFDITSNFWGKSQEGLCFRTIKGKHMKDSMKLISFVIYY